MRGRDARARPAGYRGAHRAHRRQHLPGRDAPRSDVGQAAGVTHADRRPLPLRRRHPPGGIGDRVERPQRGDGRAGGRRRLAQPCSQLTRNAPWPSTAEGAARATPCWVTIVIGWAPLKEARVPVCPLMVAEVPVNETEPKFVSNPEEGPSMTHSAEVRFAFLERCVVWKVCPVVLLVSRRTNESEAAVTSPVKESPGRTGMPMVTRLFGYISYQA